MMGIQAQHIFEKHKIYKTYKIILEPENVLIATLSVFKAEVVPKCHSSSIGL